MTVQIEIELEDNGEERETRTKVIKNACECPYCHASLPMIQSTEEWQWSKRKRRWRHSMYDLGTSYCDHCEIVIEGGYEYDYIIDVSVNQKRRIVGGVRHPEPIDEF